MWSPNPSVLTIHHFNEREFYRLLSGGLRNRFPLPLVYEKRRKRPKMRLSEVPDSCPN